MNLSISKTLGAALVAVSAMFGAVAPSHSAVIVLNFDPAYGAAFPDLGWRVTADLFVPEACTLPDRWFAASFRRGCEASAVRNTVLHFYNLRRSVDDSRAADDRRRLALDPTPLPWNVDDARPKN